ncbi:MAG: helix-turn-helix domain-containing protein [Dechloromonas sp.]|uniref:helix-turn-helix domain-containing protein n=1 Tax=Dechloromonas sp. TaxID=1917218 RepID=UPI0027F11C39|nr:helix-turn-helix domain-containing protein [Dechloromonas sp.]MBT9521093.1 helix-turn-helix domain-containing protein [Dechloromonas sp.]
MERDLLVERTQAGLARAKAEGKTLGRPSKTTQDQRSEIRHRLDKGESVSALARAYGVSRATISATRNNIQTFPNTSSDIFLLSKATPRTESWLK